MTDVAHPALAKPNSWLEMSRHAMEVQCARIA